MNRPNIGGASMVLRDLQAATSHVVDIARAEPELSGTEVLRRLRAFQAHLRHELGRATDRDTCCHCSKPISRLDSGPWRHENPARNRGCRAASFDVGEEGWDDTLDRR